MLQFKTMQVCLGIMIKQQIVFNTFADVKVHYNLHTFDLKRPVITIGNFDGVHLGHQKILQMLTEEAKKVKGESVLLTFWPHPRCVFEEGECSLRFLTTVEEKLALLEKIGLDHTVILPFEEGLYKMEAQEYIKQILVDEMHAHTVFIGHDHRFGYKGKGDFAMLEQAGAEHGFRVAEIDALQVASIDVSSTKIREALLSGNLQQANEYLSYPYSLSGTVIHGKKLGRVLGFPTANVMCDHPQKLVPANGVYAAMIKIKGNAHKTVLNIGFNPTVEGKMPIPGIEAYIFDFNEEIYGEKVTVSFMEYLRPEKKFDSLVALTEQIRLDAQAAMQYLK